MRTLIVVPCYDEADRLDVEAFVDFTGAEPAIDFLFVDDGSRDATPEVLRGLAARVPGRLSVLALQRNGGKAEAVRQGFLAGLGRPVDLLGFLDADLATPLPEIARMVDLLRRRPDLEIVLGSRVHLLGRHIERRKVRHYLGRVFATAASRTLGLAVYDTQCGAKVFRRTELLAELVAEPFVANWTFDVELLARLIRARRERGLPDTAGVLYELPLDRWTDVAGSKVRPLDFLRGIRELWRIRRRYMRRRAGVHPLEPAAQRPIVSGSPARAKRS